MSSKAVATIAPPRSLREAIAASGLTTEQIIAKVQCTRKSLSNWRAGRRPNDYFVGRLSDVLGVDLWSIYREPERIEKPHLATSPWPTDTDTKSNIDEAIQRFLTQQLRQLWDNFHFAEEPASIVTIQLAEGWS